MADPRSGILDVRSQEGAGTDYHFEPSAPDDGFRFSVEGEAFPRIVLSAAGISTGDGTVAPVPLAAATLPDPVTLAHGGTGATTAAGARTALGLGTAAQSAATAFVAAAARITATKTWDPASVAPAGFTSTTVTATGAVVGNPVTVGFSQPLDAGVTLTASVTAADTVTVTLVNNTLGAEDLASGTLRVDVWVS